MTELFLVGLLWPEFITNKPKVNKRGKEPSQFQIKQNEKKLSLSRLFKRKRLFFSRQSQTYKIFSNELEKTPKYLCFPPYTL